MKISLSLKNLQLEVKPKVDETLPALGSFPKKLWWICIVALTLLSIAAWWFYFSQGLTLSYNDARSHLNVARRVVDSLQPGAAQIGSVWHPSSTFWKSHLFGRTIFGIRALPEVLYLWCLLSLAAFLSLRFLSGSNLVLEQRWCLWVFMRLIQISYFYKLPP